MQKIELANALLDEEAFTDEGPKVRTEAETDTAIENAAICGLCGEDVIGPEQLAALVARAASVVHFHTLLESELQIHACPGDPFDQGDAE